MPIIVMATERDKLVWIDTNATAKVGRWCKAPEVPDLCETCFDPATLRHYPAETYREERGLRFGTCHRCTQKEVPA